MNSPVFIIVIISLMGPVIGSLIGVLRQTSTKFMASMLAFAGGVMLAISFLELIPESIEISSLYISMAGVITGSFVMYMLDKIIPHVHPELLSQEPGRNLNRTSVYLLIGIFLHNFPEGMAIAIGTVSGAQTSLVVALAIAIHNIPEGICTSAPYYHVTKNKLKSFLVSSSTAIPVLMGFLVASILYRHISDNMIGFIVAATAGIMIYITADEIIPASTLNEGDHKTIFSLMAGILLVMGLNLSF